MLPETAAVHWRPRMDAGRLRLYARGWTATTVFQVAPMVATAALLVTLHPVAAVVGVILIAHAWAITELYANRGAKVVKPKARADAASEVTALGNAGSGTRTHQQCTRRPRTSSAPASPTSHTPSVPRSTTSPVRA